MLDRLLDQPELALEGVGGTSAGAINACKLAQGLLDDGAAGANAELDVFWRRISDVGSAAFNPYRTTPDHALARSWNLDWAPAALWLDVMAQFGSPGSSTRSTTIRCVRCCGSASTSTGCAARMRCRCSSARPA